MINMFEVKFVCEVEFCYVLVVMIIDYDSWYLDYGEVDVIEIIKIFMGNVDKVCNLVKELFLFLGVECVDCLYGCDKVLEFVIFIVLDVCDFEVVVKFDVVVGCVLNV